MRGNWHPAWLLASYPLSTLSTRPEELLRRDHHGVQTAQNWSPGSALHSETAGKYHWQKLLLAMDPLCQAKFYMKCKSNNRTVIYHFTEKLLCAVQYKQGLDCSVSVNLDKCYNKPKCQHLCGSINICIIIFHNFIVLIQLPFSLYSFIYLFMFTQFRVYIMYTFCVICLLGLGTIERYVVWYLSQVFNILFII